MLKRFVTLLSALSLFSCGTPAYAITQHDAFKLAPTVVKKMTMDQLHSLCLTAMVKATEGDVQYLNRILDGTPESQKDIVHIACFLYSQGFMDAFKTSQMMKEQAK